MMRYIATIGLLMINAAAQAQTVAAEASLPEIEGSGFHRIRVAPVLSSWLTPSYANLRIMNDDNQEVPYYIESSQDYTYQEFVPYSVVSRAQRRGCCTELILENESKDAISNLHLRIQNAEVFKEGTLSASDDRENWYVLKEKLFFTAIRNPAGTSEIRMVDFPLSNYRFYKLIISDSSSAPLNIINAGYYREFMKKGTYSPLTGYSVRTADNGNTIRITLDTLQWVDRIVISAGGTPLFRRRASLFNIVNVADKKRPSSRRDFLVPFYLEHDRPAVIELSNIKTDDLLIAIENLDNPPLRVDSVSLFQVTHYLVAYLEKGQPYKITIGDEQMEAPRYGLQQFRNEIPASTPVLDPGKVQSVRRPPGASSTFFTREVMWIGLIGVILVLGIFSFRMVRETQKQNRFR